MTKANEFDKINELLIERTAKKFERASKNKLKKVLDKLRNIGYTKQAFVREQTTTQRTT